MADPSGYKTFAAGEVLDAAAGVMAYLMDQVVTVWADASARTSGLTPAEGQVSYLKDTNTVYLYNGSAWVAVGGVGFSGTTANGMLTYNSASTITTQSTATYASDTLTLTGSGGGLKMDGLNSSDANTLDDYEEGSFTVAFTAASGTITADSSYDRASFIKIGKLVYFQAYIALSSVSSPSGMLTMTGLPFTSSSTGMPELSDYSINGSIIREAGSDIAGNIYGQIGPGVTTMTFRGGGGTTTLQQTLAGNIDAGSSFWLGGCYRADT